MARIRLWLDHQLPGVETVEEVVTIDSQEWAEMTTEAQAEVASRDLDGLIADHISCGWEVIEE